MSRGIRAYLPHFLAVLGVVILGVGVGSVIVLNQRLRPPWEHRYTLRVALSDAAAITPGQGQTVTVSGIKVGEISKVALEDGHAVVSSEIDPKVLPRVYRDATVLVRPRTLLADQTLELDPGHPRAGALGDRVVSAGNTLPNVNLVDVLDQLDGDSRAYLKLFVNGAGKGLEGRALDVRRTLGSLRPVLGGTRRLTAVLGQRRTQTRRLVHSLAQLSKELAHHQGDLRRLVSASDATFGTLARRERELGDSVALLPGTLRGADRALADLRPFARELRPTLTRLAPTARSLTPALVSTRPLFEQAPPDLASLRRFAVAARPVVRDTRAAGDDLLPVVPDLTRGVDQLKYATNELAYEPPGPDRSYLFWTSWVAHNINSFWSGSDANGAFWRLTVIFGCDQLTALPNLPSPVLGQLLNSGKACATTPPGP